jgi:hypothetical protein
VLGIVGGPLRDELFDRELAPRFGAAAQAPIGRPQASQDAEARLALEGEVGEQPFLAVAGAVAARFPLGALNEAQGRDVLNEHPFEGDAHTQVLVVAEVGEDGAGTPAAGEGHVEALLGGLGDQVGEGARGCRQACDQFVHGDTVAGRGGRSPQGESLTILAHARTNSLTRPGGRRGTSTFRVAR